MEKAVSKKEKLYDFFIDELVSKIKGAYKYVDWTFKLVDIGKIIVAAKESEIENGQISYAYTKKISVTSSVEVRKIVQIAAEIHFSGQLVSNNKFQDYVDDLMYDFYIYPDKFYTSEIKTALTEKEVILKHTLIFETKEEVKKFFDKFNNGGGE